MKRLLSIIIFFITLVLAGKSYAFIEKNLEHFDLYAHTNYNELNENKPFEIMFEFKLKDNWHIYSETPQEIALPTKVKLDVPLGYEIIETKWSKDDVFEFEGIKQYGYGDKAFYHVIIKPLPNSGLKSANFIANVSWLGCKDECVPGKIKLDFSLPITNLDVLPNNKWASKIIEANTPKTNNNESFLSVIIMAFLGGIILNLMPCIFPILSLKAISLAQSAQKIKTAKLEALLYMAGVVISFMIIATILIILRSKGEEIGWGFQLQSPVFVAIMIVIFFFIFLMLLDVVSLKNPFANKIGRISISKQKLNAFLTGFFAVLIASPCTAPFMGIAIGYTISKPVYIYYPVFLALSLGYALPFTLIGFFPKAIRAILPKPGKWMDLLKKIFAIPVFLTCVWLSWVLYNQTNINDIDAETSIVWQKYDEEKIAALLSQNKPVFINFSAKWCITCLMNDKFQLSSAKFAKIIKEKDISIFKADWTNYEPNITKELEKYGRNSVPLYVYYNGKNNSYVILPQIISQSDLIKYLN